MTDMKIQPLFLFFVPIQVLADETSVRQCLYLLLLETPCLCVDG